jgi:hypothetical protein
MAFFITFFEVLRVYPEILLTFPDEGPNPLLDGKEKPDLGPFPVALKPFMTDSSNSELEISDADVGWKIRGQNVRDSVKSDFHCRRGRSDTAPRING